MKTGDRVVATKSSRWNGKSYQEGDIGTIVSFRETFDNGELEIQFDDGRTVTGCSGQNFKEAQMKFKVGDKVTVVDRNTLVTTQRQYIGKTFEIEKVYLQHTVGLKDAYKLDNGGSLLFLEDELQAAPKFAVGDRVKIIGNSRGGSLIAEDIGKTGKIYDITSGCYSISESSWWWPEVDLEKQEDTMTKEEALKKAIDGQKVRPVDYAGNNTYITFNGRTFVYNSGDRSSKVINENDGFLWENSQWEIYTPPQPKPKFSIGDIVSIHNGSIGKIVSDPEYCDGIYSYQVLYNVNHCKLWITEENLCRV